MIELFVLSGVGLLAVAAMLFPLRQQIGLMAGVALMGIVLMGGGYYLWGNWSGWRAQVSALQRIEQAKVVMKSFKNTDEVIQKLKQHLDHTPKHAKGWFLLGRVYASQGKWLDAQQAFAEAHRLAPADETYAVQALMSQWQVAAQQMSPALRQQFHQLLARYPKQPDLLACLAMDATAHHQATLAKQYWRRLLVVLPIDSAEAKWVRQQIAQVH